MASDCMWLRKAATSPPEMMPRYFEGAIAVTDQATIVRKYLWFWSYRPVRRADMFPPKLPPITATIRPWTPPISASRASMNAMM